EPRGGLRARVHDRDGGVGVVAPRVHRAGPPAGDGDRRRLRRRLRSCGRAAVRRRRAGHRDPGRAVPAPLHPPDRPGRGGPPPRLRGGGGGRGRTATAVPRPRRVEELAEPYGLEVVRTPAAPAELTKAAIAEDIVFAGATGGVYVFPKFLPGYDAVASLCTLL